MRWVKRLLILLLVVALLVGLAGVWLVRRGFPVVDGSVTVAGLEGPVTITRDARGIPVIEASTAHDLFLAQGYVHAQDRFWQMDVWRHIGAGRLAEMFGESQVETDAFLRTLGFERIATEEYANATQQMRSALDAYAAGVNAYLAERPGGPALSLEYAVLGLQNGAYRPAEWTPVHSLTWAKVMAWDLRSNLNDEIDRGIIAGIVGVERTEQLYPAFPDEHAVIVASGPTDTAAATRAVPEAGPALARAAANLSAADLGRPFEGIGSNNWVVDGSRTASGAPLLANDPHLGIQMPSIWYEVGLWCTERTDDCPFRVSGFSFPGAPGVIVGHNERIAWGVTNLAPDTMDLFIERTDGDGRYEVDGEWVEFDTRSETIEVAGGDDVELEIRTTRHGPVISGRFGALDDLDGGGVELPDDHEIALQWQALEPSTLFEAILAINLAEDWTDFREAAAMFDIAPQNLVYADVDGHIGYQATGEIPIRRAGDGRYPVPGWTSEFEWEGLIPADQLPYIADPDSGMIVTANQPVLASDADLFIGIDHAYGFRSHRITELLEGLSGATVADMVAIQMDNHDASATFVVPAVIALDAADPAVGAVQDILGAWASGPDPHQMSADSSGAAVYAAVWRHLLALTFDDELPEDQRARGNGRYFETVRQLLADPTDPWWDDVTTAETETADTILAQAAQAAHAELTDLLGDDPAQWRWGDLHVTSFENQTLGQSGIGPIESLFNRVAPPGVGGGAAIPNATSWVAPEGYDTLAIPSMRMVVDLADLGASVTINSTGQSGHAFHRHYADQIRAWVDGTTGPMPFDPSSLTDPAGVLRLTGES